MHSLTMTTRCSSLPLLVVALVLGCGPSSGHRLSDDEWSQMFSMPSENTKAASELVRRDAESRQQWLALEEKLQAERAEVGRQRDELEQDRRTWASRERNDPIIAAAISALGILAACSLPLIVVAALIWKRQPDESSDVVCEILVEDLTSNVLKLAAPADSAKRLE